MGDVLLDLPAVGDVVVAVTRFDATLPEIFVAELQIRSAVDRQVIGAVVGDDVVPLLVGDEVVDDGLLAIALGFAGRTGQRRPLVIEKIGFRKTVAKIRCRNFFAL